ncbi:hypothetical protein V494_07988, partial [Pseudogymnoascus sp. VKM F-4513 (FW-928)]
MDANKRTRFDNDLKHLHPYDSNPELQDDDASIRTEGSVSTVTSSSATVTGEAEAEAEDEADEEEEALEPTSSSDGEESDTTIDARLGARSDASSEDIVATAAALMDIREQQQDPSPSESRTAVAEILLLLANPVGVARYGSHGRDSEAAMITGEPLATNALQETGAVHTDTEGSAARAGPEAALAQPDFTRLAGLADVAETRDRERTTSITWKPKVARITALRKDEFNPVVAFPPRPLPLTEQEQEQGKEQRKATNQEPKEKA